MTVRLTRDLLAMGFTHNELARQSRSGELVRLRRGAYDSAPDSESSGAAVHLRVIEATLQLTAPDAVLSHVSAAVAHGLPVFADQLGRVHVTRDDVPGGKKRRRLHLHAAPLDDSEIVELNGIRGTSLARTVVDLGRTLAFEQAVMAGDAALNRGLTLDQLACCLGLSRGRPGIARARRVVAFLDARSESPGESLSRVALHTVGVPAPTLQHEVFDSSGRLIGRSDFCWEAQRTLGEFDGRVKYGRLLEPGQTSNDVIYREKIREDAMRDEDWQMVRWTYPEIRTPMVIAKRLFRAFARGTSSR